jgi:hypothetical protein
LILRHGRFRFGELATMKFSLYRFLIVFVLIFQIVLFICLNTYLNALADPYRYEERRNALMNWGNTHTPESDAVVDRKLKLLDEHIQNKAIIMFAVFLVIDGIGIYYFWNYGIKSAPDSK